MLRSWLERFSRKSRRSIRRPSAIEALEARTLLTTTTLTAADPALYGTASTADSGIPSISDSGNIIAFQSLGQNLLPGVPTSGQIYAYNQTTDTLTLVTPKSGGTGPSSAGGYNPVVSSDGRFVLFFSPGKDLTSNAVGTSNSSDQLFLRDLQTNTTTLISVATDGTTMGDGDSGGDSNFSIGGINPSLYRFSGDGRYVLFWSSAKNLVANAPASGNQLYLRDLQTNTTRLVSVDSSGTAAAAPNNFDTIAFQSASISHDGRYISYTTKINGLVPGDTNGLDDVYLRDMTAQTTQLVSAAAGTSIPGTSEAKASVMSADGKLIYFLSSSQNLVSGATIHGQQLYVRDLQSEVTSLISHAIGNPLQESNSYVESFSASRDGQFAAFASYASNLVTGDTNGLDDIFHYDRSTQAITLISKPASATGISDYSFTPIMSADGSTIVFGSDSTNLVDGFVDQNDFYPDYYIYRQSTDRIELLTADRFNPSFGQNSQQNIAFRNQYAVLNADGSSIAFQSKASNLVADDNNHSLDVFLRSSAGTQVISRRDSSLSPAFAAGGTIMGASADGRYVLISSSDPIIDRTQSRLFIRDTSTGAIEPLSGNSASVNSPTAATISPNGRYVVFVTNFNLVQLYDRVNHSTEVISVTPNQTNSTGFFSNVDVSDDGRYVAFAGAASDLLTGFTDGNANQSDVYLRDRQTGQTVLVNRKQGTSLTSSNAGLQAVLRISSDGQRVFFDTSAFDLTSNDTNGPNTTDVYYYDVASGTVSLASANAAGNAAGSRTGFSISADGRYLAWTSSTDNVVAGVPGNVAIHAYVRDLQTGVNQLLDVSTSGAAVGTSSVTPQISGDGRYVIFQSFGSNLVSGVTTNPGSNIYIRDLTAQQTRIVSVAPNGTTAGDKSSTILNSEHTQISPNGRFVLFESDSSNLVSGFVDGNGTGTDLYVRDMQTGQTALVSINRTGTASGNRSSSAQGGSRVIVLNDGKVFFASLAIDLTPVLDANGALDAFFSNPFAPSGGTVQGKVFEDLNGNGQQESNEHGLFNAVIYVDADNDGVRDLSELFTKTEVDGSYTLTGVPLGTQRIRQEAVAGTQFIQPVSGVNTITLASDGQVILFQNFAEQILRPDLTIGTPTVTVSGGGTSAVTVAWTVTNQGQFATPVADWQDAVYLSRTPTLNAGAILLGTLPHSGSLAVGASYQSQMTVDTNGAGDPTIPYYIVVQSDRQHAVSESNENNNLSQPGPLTLEIPTLTVGTPSSITFDRVGVARYYQVTLQSEQVVRLSLQGNTPGAASEIYVSRGSVPTRSVYDFRAAAPDKQNQDLALQANETGETFYILVYASQMPSSTTSTVTLNALTGGFHLDSIDQTTGDAGGSVTLQIRGSGFFKEIMTAELMDEAGHSVAASQVQFVDATQIFATFDLRSLPAGSYSVKLSRNYQKVILSDELDALMTFEPVSDSTTLPQAFTVIASQPERTETHLNLPSAVRLGRPIYFTVTYTNQGTHDVPAPLLKIVTRDDVLMSSPDHLTTGQPGTLTVLALSPDGPADIIRPGQTVVITVTSRSLSDAAGLHFDVFAVANDSTPLNYSSFLDSLGSLTIEEKPAALAALEARYGTTSASFIQNLRKQAAQQASLGIAPNTALELLLDTLFSDNSSDASPSPNQVLPQTMPQSNSDLMPQSLSADSDTGGPQVMTMAAESDPISLAACQFALTQLAQVEIDAGAQTAGLTLLHFLQGNGRDLTFDKNTLPASQARSDSLGKVIFREQEAAAIQQATQILEGRIKSDNLDTSSFPVNVRPLDFYLNGFDGSQILLFPSASLNLQITFGGMRRAQAIVTDIHYDVVKDSGGGDCHVIYTAKIQYVFEDDYTFDADDVGKSPFNACAAALQAAGWAQSFVTKIELESKLGGSVQKMNDPDCVPKPPETPDGELLDSGDMRIQNSHDPNDIVGPAGYGTPQFLVPQAALPYVIHFENDPQNATAPAQEVTVTEQLDPDLDWSTFQFGELGFGSRAISIPQGTQSFQQRVSTTNQDGSPLLVDVSGHIDLQSGVLTWTFTSVDPDTGLLPDGVLDGFLPVNDATGRGEGYVTYSVSPKASLTTGTQINASASIVFDSNTPVLTNVFTNTVDVTSPTSTVAVLPASSGTTTFAVTWSGNDGNGSGIANYDIYVSENDGPFVLWLNNTELTSANYAGQNQHKYAFYSVATDHVGFVETGAQTAEATTIVNEVPQISVNGPDVTWAKKDQPVTVLPQLTVGNTNLGGGTLTVSATASSSKKKRLDTYTIPAATTIGSVTQSDNGAGNLLLKIQLNENVTAAAIQTYLRGIKFSTKGKGLKLPTRTLSLSLEIGGQNPVTVTQTIQVKKKP